MRKPNSVIVLSFIQNNPTELTLQWNFKKRNCSKHYKNVYKTQQIQKET